MTPARDYGSDDWSVDEAAEAISEAAAVPGGAGSRVFVAPTEEIASA